ncbi:hypothetical protein B0T22DRAFT_160226 [Podospora appendiculata]|uniref:Nucleoporin n=1 Tax=Podospora appendiculata TaxID=314037 RepID=A0AAE1CCM0_9PEZI|nr:hypothetical protein B0T22DRAFT_160226 [Podospora appendiculata]
MFGTQQPQQQGGLFGQTASQPQQQGGLFGTTTTTQQQQQPQQQATGGLFGNTAAQPQQQQQTGGLFGSAQPQQQPQQTGGLFGSTTSTPQPAQTGGLFGSTQPQQQQQQQQQQPQTGGGLFGNTTTNAGATTTGGMFSSKPGFSLGGGGIFSSNTQPQQQQQQQQQQPGFGQQSTQNVGLTMGQSNSQQPQVVPGVRIDVSNVRSTTRFNDLQEDLQKTITHIDDTIQKYIRDKEAIDVFLPAHEDQVLAIPNDVNFVSRKSEGAHGALSGDIVAINQLRELIKRDADNARLSFKATDNMKLPAQYHQPGLWSTRGQQAASGPGSADTDAESNADLISYFSKTGDEMDEMMKRFERNLGEIEGHLTGVQGNMLEQLQRVSFQAQSGNQGGVDERVMELAAVLRDFEEGILKVAGVVGGVREGVTELQLKDFMGYN